MIFGSIYFILQESILNPQGTPEHLLGEQLPIPNPVRSETLADIHAAQATIAITHCSSDAYNDCTSNFEREREACTQESCDARKQLIADIGGDIPVNNEAELSVFGSSMLSYIQSTNDVILNGGENELESQLHWYHTAFGGDGSTLGVFEYTSASSAYAGALALLGSERLDVFRGKVEGIQSSSESLETKLFQLSALLYQVGKESGAPSELENAHNIATRDIIQRVIESTDRTFAVGYSQETGYFTTETISGASSELEIGTYLCSLNKSGNLNKETLGKVFSPTELFSIIEKYKNGEFGDENIRELFPSYLQGFDINMEKIISEIINMSQSPQEISYIVQSGLNTEHINAVLGRCELCSKIENYSYTDIQAISPEEMEVYKNNPATSEFYIGLQKKIEFHEKTLENIESTLRNLLLESLGQETLPVGLEEKLNISTLETYHFMEAYFQENAGSICKVDLIQLLQSDTSPLQSLLQYVEQQQNVTIDLGILDTAITDISHLGIDEQVSNLQIQEEVLKIEIEKITNIPASERSNEQNRILEAFVAQLSDIQRDIGNAQQSRNRQVEASEIRGLNQEQINELKNYMIDHNLSWSSAIDAIQGRDYDFSDESLVDFFLERPEHIRSIQRKEDLMQFLEASEGKLQNDERIELYEIFPSLRGEIEVLQRVKNLQVSDINLIPESFFEVKNSTEVREKLGLLLTNSFESLRLILAKFDTHTSPENKIYLVEAIASFLSQTDTRQYNYVLSQIPAYIPDGIFGADIDKLLPRQEQTSESSDYDMFQSTYTRIMNGAQETTQEDKDFIHRYFSKYGALENKGQFINLLQQKKLEARTLQEIVPNMSNLEAFKDIIKVGIQINSSNFTELLPHSLHRNEEIIEWTLLSCFTDYESVDIGFQSTLRATQQSNLLKASNILQIQDAPGLYAAYTGLGNNSELLRKLFWNKFESAQQLQGIVENAGEVYTSKFTRAKVDVILKLVREISEKQEEENTLIGTIGEIQEVIRASNDRKSVEFAKTYLERYFPGPDSEKQIAQIIGMMENTSFNPETIFPLIENLIKDSGIENQGVFDRKAFYENFLGEIQEGAQVDQAQAGEVDFTRQEIGSFPTNLLEIGEREEEESFEIGVVPSGQVERNHRILKDYIAFLEVNEKENTRESIEAYIEKYGIELSSRFGESLVKFIEAEETIITAYLSSQPPIIDSIIEASERYNSGDNNAFSGIQEEIQILQASGKVDYSQIRDTREILQERGLQINNNGEIVETKNQIITQAPLLPQNIKSPDLRDTYREISYELNLSQAESQSLTEDELKMIAGDETLKENFINFRQTLKDLNLESIWQFRNQIFKAIGSLDFNISDGNYIEENELNIFLSKVSYATLGSEKAPELQTTPANIDTTYRVLRRENNIGTLVGQKDISAVGEGGGIIENLFREKFAPKNAGILEFKIGAFLEALSGKNMNS